MEQTIAVASDHGGRILKQKIIEALQDSGISVRDFGVPFDDATSVDYPDLAAKVAPSVTNGETNRGILVCGTGIGMSIAANKVPGVRAALVWDEFTAKMARQHNDANVLCLGERVINHDRAVTFVNLWLQSEFEGSRHLRRLDKIKQLES